MKGGLRGGQGEVPREANPHGFLRAGGANWEFIPGAATKA